VTPSLSRAQVRAARLEEARARRDTAARIEPVRRELDTAFPGALALVGVVVHAPARVRVFVRRPHRWSAFDLFGARRMVLFVG